MLDRVEVRVSGLTPPPEGSAYRVWLLSDDQTALVFVGDLGFIGPEEGIVAWSQPAGEPLFIEFSEALITLESGPIGPAAAAPVGEPVLRGRVDSGALVFFRRLLVRWPDSRYGTGSMQGLRQSSGAMHFHAAILREAAALGDLETVRRKAEHVVNMIEGQGGAAYGDHDGNGRAEDPGDGVGLLPYGSGVLTHTQFAWATAFDERVAEAALAVQPPVQLGLEWAGVARQLALDLTATSAVEDAVAPAALLFAATEQLVVAVDPRWSESLTAQARLAERVPAYESALALAQLHLLPGVPSVPSVPSVPGGTTATANAALGGS